MKVVGEAIISGAALILVLGSIGGCGSDRDAGFAGRDGGGLESEGGSGRFADAGPPRPLTSCEKATAEKSSVGCDYYAVTPDIFATPTTTLGLGACFAAFVANTSQAPVTLSVDRGGQNLDVAKFGRIPSGSGTNLSYAPLPGGVLPAGEVAILFLGNMAPGFKCPDGITAAVTTEDTAVHGTGMGKAFHIRASEPVVAYDIFPYGGAASAATSATLLLPTSAWDTNYLAVDAFRNSELGSDGVTPKPFVEIVAAQDDTHVTISPTAAIVGGSGVAATGKGQLATYALAKGQVLQLTQDDSLVGSPIQSDKPIGLWAGATLINIDVKVAAGDSAHQQIPPIRALGHEYVAARYRDRVGGLAESPPWRMMGAVSGTVLTYDPSVPPGAPTTLEVGQVAEFEASDVFVVKSQDDKHPFYMSGHMTGGDDTGQQIGDPEFVNLVPPQQHLSQYVFFADPTYPETNLVIVRGKGAGGFEDVTLDCAGKITGWTSIGTSASYEVARVDLVKGDFQKQAACDNGRHEMTSAAPFGLTVWGWGHYVSYAYPAGAGLKAINSVVVAPK